MRVAALYDVHGNLPALEAVLAEVPDDAVILVGGDVAMGPLPSETLERLRESATACSGFAATPTASLRPARRAWRRRTRSTGRGSSCRTNRSSSSTGCPSDWSST